MPATGSTGPASAAPMPSARRSPPRVISRSTIEVIRSTASGGPRASLRIDLLPQHDASGAVHQGDPCTRCPPRPWQCTGRPCRSSHPPWPDTSRRERCAAPRHRAERQHRPAFGAVRAASREVGAGYYGAAAQLKQGPPPRRASGSGLARDSSVSGHPWAQGTRPAAAAPACATPAVQSRYGIMEADHPHARVTGRRV